MKIHNECTFINPEGIAKVEEMYNATYVFESCLKTRDGGWSNFPVAIFYTEKAHPQGSNYFGLYRQQVSIDDKPHILIVDAISATEMFVGLQVGEDIIYSRYRHDYRQLDESEDGAFIDGGRDYVRTNPEIGKLVHLKVVKDKLELVDDLGQN